MEIFLIYHMASSDMLKVLHNFVGGSVILSHRLVAIGLVIVEI